MSETKFYQLGTHSESEWDSLHAELTSDGHSCDHVPSRCVSCADDKLHSPTRGTYLLTDEEATILKSDPRIKFINIDYSKYPDQFKPPPKELQASTPEFLNRWNYGIKNYKNITGTLGYTDPEEINRTGYQLLRCQQKDDPWLAAEVSNSTPLTSDIQQYGTGKDVDVVVADDGTWFGHPEFQKSVISVVTGFQIAEPARYGTNNLFNGTGSCDVFDLVLDGPFYLDPDWFNASPSTRLTTRWDGAVVPVESVARDWWGDSGQRSPQFASAGVVPITLDYTRANNNGSNVELSIVGDHGTACAALAFGRTQGWAYNANKWAFNMYEVFGTGIEEGFDLVKLFHELKPVNPTYLNKNPTVMSNSWGYRSNKDPSGANRYYTHRTTSNVLYTTEAGIPWLSHMGTQGDGGRWKSEMKTNSLTVALDELIDSGVIFVVASGNSNQKQVNYGHPDFNNYITDTDGGSLNDSTFFEFGVEVYGTTNRRGFPQQGGKYTKANGSIAYKTINIGALDDQLHLPSGKESKVGYSDRGEGIDCYAPADGTLAANRNYTSAGPRPDTYPEYRQSTGPLVDTGVSGVYSSSALLIDGTFLPESNSAFSITTVSGTATIIPIELDLKNITTNPDITPTSFNNLYPYDDEAYWTVALPWTIDFNGTNYNEVYVGSNSYLTFGGGSQGGFEPSPSATFPAFDKIMVSADDLSCQRIYTDTQGISPNRIFIIRYQGHIDYEGGALDGPTMEYEYHFFENTSNKIELHVNLNGKVVPDLMIPAPIIATDTLFSGTSAACPVAAGFIASYLEFYRTWTWADIKSWLERLDVQDDLVFYKGTESTTALTSNWIDYRGLEGGSARVIYQGRFPAGKKVMRGNVIITKGAGLRFTP